MATAEPEHASSDVFTIERARAAEGARPSACGSACSRCSDESDEPLTNRELAQRLGVDPGHLHFHVRMLLRAGLIERAEGGKGREKPYRAVGEHAPRRRRSCSARAWRGDLQAAMLDEVQAGLGQRGRGPVPQRSGDGARRRPSRRSS